MNDAAALLLAFIAGAALGAIFFCGLWWTVRQAMSSARPALWVFASLPVRLAIAMGGFYLAAGGHWQRLLLCLAGFIVARMIVTRLLPAAGGPGVQPAPQWSQHAP